MKKRIWSKAVSIFTAILLVVGIVPNTTITALAAEGAPSSLYVGNYQITNSDTPTYLKAGLTEGSLTEGSETDWTVKYDPSTAILTLSGATIQGADNTESAPFGSGIYAQGNSNQPVALTIELIGTNTITGYYGIFLNAEISASSYGTNATLTITGENNGSLGVSGSNHGIYVKSGTGNAFLNIKNVAVTSSTNGNYAAGIYVMSSNYATNSPNISLSVDGGSLTASGTGSSDGIWFYVGSPQASDATTSLTVSRNAIVDARNGGIKASDTNMSDLSNQIVVGSGTGNSGGIVFNGTEGTVYGNVTLQEDITINQGESLTIGNGSSLNTGNNNVIVNGGTLNGEDKITGTVKYEPTITTESLPEGKVNEEYSTSLSANGSEPIEWNVTQGSLPTGLSLSTDGKIAGTPTVPGEYVFTVTASNDAGSVSKELTINVKDVDPIYGIQNSGDISFADALEGYTPEVKTITITNDGNQPITLDQPVSSESFEVGTLSKTELNVGETAEFTVQPKTGLLAGSYDENVKITGTNNGKSASTTVNVKFNVNHNPVKVERKDPTCTEDGNIEYWYCDVCNKYFSDAEFKNEISIDKTLIPATGHNLIKIEAKDPTVDGTGNSVYWYCQECGNYFSDAEGKNEIALEDTIIAKLPKLMTGANQEWTKGSKDGLTFKVDTDIKEFKKVLVDGKELKDTDYDIKSGSTILTLKPSYLDTLSDGKHKLCVEFTIGNVEIEFTIVNQTKEEVLETGDNTRFYLWSSIVVLSGFALLMLKKSKQY